MKDKARKWECSDNDSTLEWIHGDSLVRSTTVQLLNHRTTIVFRLNGLISLPQRRSGIVISDEKEGKDHDKESLQ